MTHSVRIARPPRMGAGMLLASGLAVLAVGSLAVVEGGAGSWLPSSGGLELAGRFFARALSPALVSEARFVPEGSPPLLVTALSAVANTFGFAASALALALALGLPLALVSAHSAWGGDPARGATRARRLAVRVLPSALLFAARALATFLRSIHELIWAVLFLVAFGLSNLAAVLAIALPFAGVFAKVFSELIDEAPPEAGRALRDAGASATQVFCLGVLPRALPDMAAYAFYRMECALRASAVLGFFGFPTLGLHLRQSFASANYGEVWTFLYVLIATVLGFELLSSAVRRRLVG